MFVQPHCHGFPRSCWLTITIDGIPFVAGCLHDQWATRRSTAAGFLCFHNDEIECVSAHCRVVHNCVSGRPGITLGHVALGWGDQNVSVSAAIKLDLIVRKLERHGRRKDARKHLSGWVARECQFVSADNKFACFDTQAPVTPNLLPSGVEVLMRADGLHHPVVGCARPQFAVAQQPWPVIVGERRHCARSLSATGRFDQFCIAPTYDGLKQIQIRGGNLFAHDCGLRVCAVACASWRDGEGGGQLC